MPTSRKRENKNRLRFIIILIVGIVAFVVSVYMNIVGMRNAINKAPDSSGMAAFSVRTAIKSDEKEIKVDKSGKVVEEDILVNALPVINLINNKWDRIKANFSDFKLDGKGNAIFDDGYTLFCNGTYVEGIVFTDVFEGEVVGRLKVGSSFDLIEEKLGVPTFRDSECLGYKTREVYAFFYENEIAIYPNRNISNKEFETLLNSYQDKTFEKGRTYFLVDIRNKFNDFRIEEDTGTDTMIVTSLTRQVVLKLDKLGNVEVELYNGYNASTDETKEYIKQKIYLQNEEDLVERIESERVSGN